MIYPTQIFSHTTPPKKAFILKNDGELKLALNCIIIGQNLIFKTLVGRFAERFKNSLLDFWALPQIRGHFNQK